jgi:hypothetical protein
LINIGLITEGMKMIKKLTTRGISVALAIRDRQPFTTGGALKGVTRLTSTGALSADEKEALLSVWNDVDFAVYSYATPIAWHTPSGWHVVDQQFSVTTSKHQSKLYLIK